MIATPREQRPPHDCIKDMSYRCKVMRCAARSLSEWLSETGFDQVYGWYQSIVRASQWFCLHNRSRESEQETPESSISLYPSSYVAYSHDL